MSFGELRVLEVERNLFRILVPFRTAGEAEFTTFDTLELEFRRFLLPYLSEPVLEENVEYECRVVVQYRNHVEQVSNTVRFVTPVVKGQILDSIGCTGCRSIFDFTETSIFVLTYNDELFRIDRNTLESTQLLSGFRPLGSVLFLDMAVHGDTAMFTENTESEMTVVRVNLQTLEVDKSLKVLSLRKDLSFMDKSFIMMALIVTFCGIWGTVKSRSRK
ncbi:hypothetical protein GWN28_27895 [candidate division KSB1 bacterium]|nr:hypothetical protein [candidate division KSB1 bacterium]NIW22104.1 hypothetical protein [candidate division KSB1 bacterium]NIW72621.1 hypothetical protein [candidate division KSB1 bacterium]